MNATAELVAAPEEVVDCEETARLANAAFPEGGFTAEHLKWLYERCFSHGGTVVSLRHRGRKVGQFIMLRQIVHVGGVPEEAVQLVDLFVLKDFRSRAALSMLYDEVARQCERQGVRFAIGMPNERAVAANEFFFGLKPHLWLDIRAGLAFPGLLPPFLLVRAPYARDQVKYYAKWFEAYEPPEGENGIAWRAKENCERLNTSRFSYGLHAVENLLLVSSPRVRRGVPYTLYCGFFVRRGRDAARHARGHALSLACVETAAVRLSGRLSHTPGTARLANTRHGPSLNHAYPVRDFQPHKPPLQWDRYQSIDFDFA